MKNIFKSKSKIKTASVVFSTVLICLIAPIITHAGLANSIAKAIFRFLGNIILGICTFFLKLAGNFFEDMIYAGFNNYSYVIKDAWTTIKDFANIFFIFGMIIIAFATILRIEKYGVKKVLPKLIITALLINFSMVFCYVFIDASNLIANSFIKMSEKEYSSKGISSFSAAIADGLNQTKLLMPAACMDNEEYEDALDSCKDLKDETQQKTCKDNTEKEQAECIKKQEKALEDAKLVAKNQTAFEVFTTVVASAIIMIIATVILFAGGIVLIARIVMIWVLVAMAPLAAACSFLPALKSSWEKWSKSFLNWCIFAPAYSLFIWLALKVSFSIKENALTQPKIDFTAGSAFFLEGSIIIKYAMIIGILLVGLIVSKQLGVAGGNMAYNFLKKQGGKAGGWLKDRTLGRAGRLAKETGQMYRGATRQIVGKGLQWKGFKKLDWLGVRSTGARIEAKGKLDWRKPLDSKEMKQKKAEFAAMTPEQRAIMASSKLISNQQKLNLAQVAVEKKDNFAKDINYAKQARDIFQAYGMTSEAKEMERRNPQIIEGDANLREQRTKEGIAKGYHKDWDKEMFQGRDGEILVETMANNARDFHEFARTFSELSLDAQEEWKKAARTMLPMSEKTRQAYAIVTGRPDEAYASAPAHTKGYIEAMRSNELENIELSSIPRIADHISASAAIGARGMSDEKKKALAAEWQRQWENLATITTAQGHIITPAEQERIDAIDEKLAILRKSPEWKSFVR